MPTPRPRSLRRLLGLMTIALVLPMLVLAAVVGALQVGAERRRVETEAMADALRLLHLTERLVALQAGALHRLAHETEGGDPAARLGAFHAATGLHVTLLDPAGATRADTRDTPLPPGARAAARALAQGGAAVSPLVADPASDGHALLIVEWSAAGLLVLALPATRLLALFQDPSVGRFHARRFPMLVDAEGIVVARWKAADTAVGQPMPASARDLLLAQPAGIWHGVNMDGEPTLVAYLTSPMTGLAVGVGVTEASLVAPIWRAVLLLGPATLALVALAGLASMLVARRIAGPVGSLGAAAAALAEGKPPPRLATPVAEVNAVAEAMADAADRRRAAEAQRDLLVRELHHRVKNLLTTAQSLATLSARSAQDPADFARQFGERLRSLARTHTLLLEEQEGVLALRTLVAEVVAPYRLGVGRIAITGPEVRLPAEAAVPLGMVLHELATNAVKYGALSVVSGRLDIAWRLLPAEGAPLLVLDWTERDGPGISAPPRRQGFGSQLLHRALAALPHGKAEVEWRAQGVSVRLTLGLRGGGLDTAQAPGVAATS